MKKLRRQASKREEKSDKVKAQGSLETAPFILEPGLRGQVLPLRSHCKVQQARGPRNESFREAGPGSYVGPVGGRDSGSSL